MARSPGAKHDCPLFNRRINWSLCYEVQEVREDNMDIDFFPGSLNINEANIICEKCRWCYVDINE